MHLRLVHRKLIRGTLVVGVGPHKDQGRPLWDLKNHMCCSMKRTEEVQNSEAQKSLSLQIRQMHTGRDVWAGEWQGQSEATETGGPTVGGWRGPAQDPDLILSSVGSHWETWSPQVTRTYFPFENIFVSVLWQTHILEEQNLWKTFLTVPNLVLPNLLWWESLFPLSVEHFEVLSFFSV